MPIDEINDIEILRKLAKKGRVKINRDIPTFKGDYVFKKGYWYMVSQDEHYVYLHSEYHTAMVILTYSEAMRYIDEQ